MINIFMLFKFRYVIDMTNIDMKRFSKENSSKCIWKYGLNSSCASSPQLSTDNHHLYVATLSGEIFAFQSNDGQLLWKQTLDKPIFSTMTIWKDKFLLVGCVDQKLYCLNSDNGQQVRLPFIIRSNPFCLEMDISHQWSNIFFSLSFLEYFTHRLS